MKTPTRTSTTHGSKVIDATDLRSDVGELNSSGFATPLAPATPTSTVPIPLAEPQIGSLFTSAEIAAIHERQAALEIDRREQERLARAAELANRD